MEERLWGSLIIFSHGTSIARGDAVLVKNNLDTVIHQELSDSKGRLLAFNVKIKDKINKVQIRMQRQFVILSEFVINFTTDGARRG